MPQSFTIEEADDGIRLDRWFKRHFPDVPHSLLQKWLRKGAVRINGKKAETSTRVETWQVVTLPEMDKERHPEPKAKDLVKRDKVLRSAQDDERIIKETQSWIIHKDAQCLVINKPAGLAAQGGSKVKDSVDARLDALKFGGERPKLVHRLDRDTSGVLLLARNAKAAHFFTKAFALRETEKIYWALVIGVPQPYEGTIDIPLAKIRRGGEERVEAVTMDSSPLEGEQANAVSRGGYQKSTPHASSFAQKRSLSAAPPQGGSYREGKRAITEYRILEALSSKLAWVELHPITGRTHQLRAHMQAINHPILGDGKYGGKNAFIEGMELPKQLHLHARRLILTGEHPLDITAPLPRHMRESWKILGLEEK